MLACHAICCDPRLSFIFIPAASYTPCLIGTSREHPTTAAEHERSQDGSLRYAGVNHGAGRNSEAPLSQVGVSAELQSIDVADVQRRMFRVVVLCFR